MKSNLFIAAVLSVAFISCTQKKAAEIEFALTMAGRNRPEIEQTLDHYPAGSLKRRAAEYLVVNMPYHQSLKGESIDRFRDTLSKAGETGIGAQNRMWREIADRSSSPIYHLNDIQTVSCRYLIENIELAFEAWESVPWSRRYSFEDFCEYILPYKIMDEPIVGWRSHLREKYLPCMEGIEDPKEAYEAVYFQIRKTFRPRAVDYPYTRDALTLDYSQWGECPARSAYIVFVMRALGIPAAFDFSPLYANYSNIDHAWAVFVDPEGRSYTTETIKDLTVTEFGQIDGTVDWLKYPYDMEEFGYKVDSVKKIAKAYRKSYSIRNHRSLPEQLNTPPFLQDVHFFDVSPTYREKPIRFSIRTESIIRQTVYLSTFTPIYDWTPVGYAEKKRGKTVYFDHLVHEIACLPSVYVNGQVIPVSNPVLAFADRPALLLDPDTNRLREVVLRRKYLVTSRFYNRWGEFPGSRFEFGGDRYFSDTTRISLIYEVTEIPVGPQTIQVKQDDHPNFVRFLPAADRYPGVAELEFYFTDDQGVTERIPAELYPWPETESASRRLPLHSDGDELTHYEQAEPFWIGAALKGHRLSEIRYIPWTDGNHIEPGDTYELFYYDFGWKSLGRQVAGSHELVYENVPENALLWLRNLSGGKEERIFTYENGIQMWW